MNPAENPESAATENQPTSVLAVHTEVVIETVAPVPQDPREAAAAKIVQNHVLWSLSAGLIPVPVADFAAVTAVQMDALKQLATLYGVNYTDDHGKRFVAALSGGALARVGASAVKALPGVGTVLGGLSMSALSGASTFAVCQVAINHFKTNGNFLNVPVEKAKGLYQDLLAKGKHFVQEVKNSLASHHASQEVTASLQELLSLKSKGLLTEEEYEAKKALLLDKLA